MRHRAILGFRAAFRLNSTLVTKQTHGALKANETKGLHRNIGYQLPYCAAE